VLFKRPHVNVPCTILEAHGAYFDSQNLSTAILFNVLGGVAAAKEALVVMIAAVQKLLSFFSTIFFLSLEPWYLYIAFKKPVVSTSFYLF
jgi:hypothetical protein